MLRLWDPSVERIPQHAYSMSATLHTAGTLEPGHSLVQCENKLYQIEGSPTSVSTDTHVLPTDGVTSLPCTRLRGKGHNGL